MTTTTADAATTTTTADTLTKTVRDGGQGWPHIYPKSFRWILA